MLYSVTYINMFDVQIFSVRRRCTLKSGSCYELKCLLLGIFLTYDYVKWLDMTQPLGD